MKSIYTYIFICFGLLPCSLLVLAKESLSLKSLHGRIYRLQKGPINRCADKIGIETDQSQFELRVYPMEAEWTAINKNISPVLEIKSLHNPWEKENIESKTGDLNPIDKPFVTKWIGRKIESIKTSKLNETTNLEAHAVLEFIGKKLEFTQWVVSGGAPVEENVVCEYLERPASSKH